MSTNYNHNGSYQTMDEAEARALYWAQTLGNPVQIAETPLRDLVLCDQATIGDEWLKRNRLKCRAIVWPSGIIS